MMSVGLANQKVTCADIEYLHFDPPSGQTCMNYMQEYITENGGYLLNGNATADCSFCTTSETNAFLATVESYYSERWRNFGFMWAYIIFNVVGALVLYWLVRVPKKKKEKVE